MTSSRVFKSPFVFAQEGKRGREKEKERERFYLFQDT
jgi:hypothetical protein